MSIQLSDQRVFVGERCWVIKEPRKGFGGFFCMERFRRDGRWTFDGNLQSPTFSPSLISSWGGKEDCDGVLIPLFRNHLIVTGGNIQYCDDSTHELAGKTLPLEFFNVAELESMKGCY